MNIQSRTYNGGTVIEYIYTIIPQKGETYKQHVFIDVSTGQIFDPTSRILQLDKGSENSFQGVCCNDVIEELCKGWITEAEFCWTTEDGLSWSV